MDKLIRYRKAFYEKQNDLKNGNKKQHQMGHSLLYKENQVNKLYQSLSITLSNTKNTEVLKPKVVNSIKSNTQSYLHTYGAQLLQADQYLDKPSDFLKNHQVNQIFRARMLDWMIEVISSYKFNHKTYFDSASLMDKFFGNSRQHIPSSKLHIIGVQCMMIASKMQEVFPLKIKTVFQKIAHKKLPMNQLIQTQQAIANTLDFKLNTWSFFDLAMAKLVQVNTSQGSEKKNIFGSKEEKMKKMQELCSYLSKFALFSYDFYQQTSMILMAQTIVRTILQILQVDDQTQYKSTPILIELSKQKLISLIKKHKLKFNGLNNIFKFTPKEIVNLVDQFV